MRMRASSFCQASCAARPHLVEVPGGDLLLQVLERAFHADAGDADLHVDRFPSGGLVMQQALERRPVASRSEPASVLPSETSSAEAKGFENFIAK